MSAAARTERAGVRALFSPELLDRFIAESIADTERTDASAMQVVQSWGWPDTVDGERWLDTRPMLDAREVGQAMADQARFALSYALHRGLVEAHPVHTHHVRTARRRLA